MINLKAVALILVYLLTISVPVFAEETAADSNLKKIESARLIKEKALAEEQIKYPGVNITDQGEFSIIRLFQGLGLCIAAFLIGIHLYKKFVLKNKNQMPKSIYVKERIPLSSKSQLCVVEYNGKPLLLAVGSENVSFFQDSEILTSLGSYTEELCSEKVN